MTYEEVLAKAKNSVGTHCRACSVCNGRACGNQIPGPGAKGVGDTAVRNFEAWQKIRVNMDTIEEMTETDTTLELFGHSFRFPFFAGPVGAVNMHYGDKYDDFAYNNLLVQACADLGIAAFTGDGINPQVHEAATMAIKSAGGMGIPTVKPWDEETVAQKMELVRQSGAVAAAMDVDAAGLPFLRGQNPPAGRKSVEQLKQIIADAGVPFIVKGVMTVKGAEKAIAAGASAIVVSNHGGRVLDQCAATAEVLPEIARAVNGRIKIFVDGGIRSGGDVFKALALGADAVIIARPFVVSVYGGDKEGVEAYVEKIGSELKETMFMCGAKTLADITPDMVRA
ncbi:MAG: alpha-hydroxy-acid oxidizing protein [Lachnospiraceae bacterium]|nr:alpha-hydroxy-acid oxidizing protein [Lachnospiraceae bacterium]